MFNSAQERVADIAFSQDSDEVQFIDYSWNLSRQSLKLENLINEAIVRLQPKDRVNCRNFPKGVCPPWARAMNYLIDGNDKSRNGDYAGAVSCFREGQKLNPDLTTAGFDPQKQIERLANSGEKSFLALRIGWLVRHRNLEKAIEVYSEARKTNPGTVEPQTWNNVFWQTSTADLTAAAFDPQKLIEPLADSAESFRLKISWLVRLGRLEKAIDVYNEAQKADTETVGPEIWNNICWQGSINGHVREVLGACKEAVSLNPENADFRDSRGVARALTKDFRGAIDDFRFFIAHTNKSDRKKQRQRWVEKLDEGKNPFTPEEMKTLVNQ